MKTLIKFLFSLFALPFLIPWYLADKIFQHFIQPRIVRKYQVGQIRVRSKSRFRVQPRTMVTSLIVFYFAVTFYRFFDSQPSFLAGAANYKVLLFVMYNDVISVVNTVLSPINNILIYAQGGAISNREALWSFSLLLVPVIVLSNFVFGWLTTRVMLRQAVQLRNQADQDVHIVAFSERAGNDEIFCGLDQQRNGAPFFAKVRWMQGHIQVIGSPGSGKTESIIQPLWYQSVRRNVPTIVLDGKASSRNVDRFYTIATSLAQGHEILYFNPSEPARSASYNPLLHGNIDAIKARLLNAINWKKQTAASHEKLDYYLGLMLQAIRKTGKAITLAELLRYFDSKNHVQQQIERIGDPVLQDNLRDLLLRYSEFQKETAFFTLLLLQICNADYAHLLQTDSPDLDVAKLFADRKDCYFTLPISTNDPAMSFLGQLILGDIQATFHHFATREHADQANHPAGNGVLIIDELAKFASPHFIDLLRTSRTLGVSVCYTNQTLAELETGEMALGKAFIDELAEHTNMIFCFNLNTPETVDAIAKRMSGEETKNVNAAEMIKQLEVGRCVVFVRQPRVFSVLKTGYFKFDKLMAFKKNESSTGGVL